MKFDNEIHTAWYIAKLLVLNYSLFQQVLVEFGTELFTHLDNIR